MENLAQLLQIVALVTITLPLRKTSSKQLHCNSLNVRNASVDATR